MSFFKQLTVVLPVYNEEKNILNLVRRIDRALSRADFKYQILVVDDGSQDSSPLILNEATKEFPLTVIRHQVNRGLGAAIRTGLLAAASPDNVVVTMDADETHDPELIISMVEKLSRGYDVVIASRYQRDSEIVGVPSYRKFLTHGASYTLRLLFPFKNVRDYSCGFRVYRGAILLKLQERFGLSVIKENGFACMLELLLKLRRVKAQAAEVPMVLRYDRKIGASKMRIVRTILRYGVVMFQGMSLIPTWLTEVPSAHDLPS